MVLTEKYENMNNKKEYKITNKQKKNDKINGPLTYKLNALSKTW